MFLELGSILSCVIWPLAYLAHTLDQQGETVAARDLLRRRKDPDVRRSPFGKIR